MKAISFVKENCIDEFRTILTHNSLMNYLSEGFTVYAEKGIGLGVGIPDETYAKCGATLVDHEQAWTICNYVAKYKAPEKADFKYFRPDLHFTSFLHAEGDYELATALVESRTTAYAYEFVTTKENYSPISIAPAEVAGKLAVFYGAYHLQTHLGGVGKLLSDIPGASRCKVVVIGYGDAGNVAIRTAASLGAKVVVFGRNSTKMRKFQATVPHDVECYVYSHDKLFEEIKTADLVIGAILISTYDTEPIITEAMVKNMKKGSLIIDVTAGYGSGYIETFDKDSNLAQPIFERHGVLHCKIDNMCAGTSLTSSEATESVVAPILIEHGNKLFTKPDQSSLLDTGMICCNGRFVHPELIKHMEYYTSQKNIK